jgi:hypothetical protein
MAEFIDGNKKEVTRGALMSLTAKINLGAMFLVALLELKVKYR